MNRQNQTRRPNDASRKRAKRSITYRAHRGQWTHCYGERCGGHGKCACRQMGAPCNGGCYMLAMDAASVRP